MGSGQRTDKDRFLAVLKINILVFIAELLVGFYSGSLAMLSDSFHVFIHVVASIIALISELKFSFLPQEKIKKLSAGINIGLFFILAFWIGHEAIKRLATPQQLNINFIFFAVAFAGLAANIYTVRILHSHSDEEFSENRDILYWEMFYDSIGSVVVIICAVAIYFTGFNIIDPILSIFLALMMLIKAVQMSLRFKDIHNHDLHYY